MKPNQGCAFCFLLLFIMAWSSGVLIADADFGNGVYRAIQSLDFVPVEGKVLRCEMKKTPSDEGYSWAVDIDYTYLVDNQRFIGNRLRVGPTLPSRHGVEEFVEEHPVDSAITVYYDPANPENAVLTQGLHNSGVFLFLFLWPFNLVMLLLWGAFAVFFLSTRSRLRIVYGARIIETTDEIRIRLPPSGPVAAALVAAFVVAVFAVFPAFCCGGVLVPMKYVVVVAFILEMAFVVAVYARVAVRNASGSANLVIDKKRQTLTLPLTLDRKQKVEIPIADFRSVEIVEEVKKTSEESSTIYVPIARWVNAKGDQMEGKLMLMEWHAEGYAQEIAAMIRSAIAAVGSAAYAASPTNSARSQSS